MEIREFPEVVKRELEEQMNDEIVSLSAQIRAKNDAEKEQSRKKNEAAGGVITMFGGFGFIVGIIVGLFACINQINHSDGDTFILFIIAPVTWFACMIAGYIVFAILGAILTPSGKSSKKINKTLIDEEEAKRERIELLRRENSRTIANYEEDFYKVAENRKQGFADNDDSVKIMNWINSKIRDDIKGSDRSSTINVISKEYCIRVFPYAIRMADGQFSFSTNGIRNLVPTSQTGMAMLIMEEVHKMFNKEFAVDPSGKVPTIDIKLNVNESTANVNVLYNVVINE